MGRRDRAQRRRIRAPRSEIAAVIAAQQQRRGAPAAARRRPRGALADPTTVAIVTGQQAGLFGGPLFTLLKALTALKLAEQVSREHGVPAVAVFWIDAEDHDWDEVRVVYGASTQTSTPRTVSLPGRGAGDAAPGGHASRLDRSIIAVARRARARCCPPTEFRAALIAGSARAYAPGAGMADAFGRWMEQVLGAARPGRVRLVGSGVEAAGQPGVRARAVDAG